MPIYLGGHPCASHSERSTSATYCASLTRTGTRRTLLGGTVASVLGGATLLAAPTSVFADETWCDVDPPVLIRTPDGNHRIVYLTDSGPARYRTQLVHPEIEYDVSAVRGQQATGVSLTVTVNASQGQAFAVQSEVWSGPRKTGELLSSCVGSADSPIRHTFRLDVP
jgi:hypothetical protein